MRPTRTTAEPARLDQVRIAVFAKPRAARISGLSFRLASGCPLEGRGNPDGDRRDRPVMALHFGPESPEVLVGDVLASDAVSKGRKYPTFPSHLFRESAAIKPLDVDLVHVRIVQIDRDS